MCVGALYVSCSAMQMSEMGILDYFISCLLNGLLSWTHAVPHMVHGVCEERVAGGGGQLLDVLDIFCIPGVLYYSLFYSYNRPMI